jgi:hypothetical protein
VDSVGQYTIIKGQSICHQVKTVALKKNWCVGLLLPSFTKNKNEFKAISIEVAKTASYQYVVF